MHRTVLPEMFAHAAFPTADPLDRGAPRHSFAMGKMRDGRSPFRAREKPWHPSQQLLERPNGRVELTLRLNHLTDIKHAVLRWGEHVEVLAPAELRHAVKASLEAARARYSSKPD